MTLGEHYDSAGGNYLEAGWHDTIVSDFETFDFNSGNRGVKFTVKGPGDRIGKTNGFVLIENSLWKLAGFAKACGMTKQEMMRYNEQSDQSHQLLLNRPVRVLVEKVDKYHEVVAWAVADGSPLPPPPEPLRQPAPVEPATGGDIPF
jgi:hypothetical protein